jgi:hypothetical protein
MLLISGIHCMQIMWTQSPSTVLLIAPSLPKHKVHLHELKISCWERGERKKVQVHECAFSCPLIFHIFGKTTEVPELTEYHNILTKYVRFIPFTITSLIPWWTAMLHPSQYTIWLVSSEVPSKHTQHTSSGSSSTVTLGVDATVKSPVFVCCFVKHEHLNSSKSNHLHIWRFLFPNDQWLSQSDHQWARGAHQPFGFGCTLPRTPRLHYPYHIPLDSFHPQAFYL